jgi:Domain of unknown function (DUF2804), N-terminal/Domain of unknown function (DUF2804), C-terminal
MKKKTHLKADKINRRRAIELAGSSALFATGASLIPGSANAADPVEFGAKYPFYCPEAIEITEPGKMVKPDGTSYCGWSRQPYLDLNYEDARFWKIKYFQKYRYKKWELYYIFTPTHYIHFLVSWIGFAAFCDLAFFDRKTKEYLSGMHIRLPEPKINMMRNPTEGRTEYLSKKIKAVFNVEGERRSIIVDAPKFADQGLHVDMELIHPLSHESISGYHMTTPHRMHYGNKINCMTVSGTCQLGDKNLEMDPKTCFGLLDFGRGFYPPRLFWYWATGSGKDGDGKLVGWNLGHGNNPDEVNENTLFYDGKLHKIGSVNCEVPSGDLYKPWKVWTDDGRVDLVYSPENAKYNEVNLGLLYSKGQGVLGVFNGSVKLDSGRRINIKDLFGIYEWVDQKW